MTYSDALWENVSGDVDDKTGQIPLRPHHFWTYTSNLTTVVKSVLKIMINGTTSILKS